VSIQKWWISAQAKAAAISQPQAQSVCAEECEERERRHGPKDSVYGWALNRRRLIPEEPPAEKMAEDGGDEDGADRYQEARDPDVAVIRFELLGYRNPDQPEDEQGA
jgi:hypothetical protein